MAILYPLLACRSPYKLPPNAATAVSETSQIYDSPGSVSYYPSIRKNMDLIPWFSSARLNVKCNPLP